MNFLAYDTHPKEGSLVIVCMGKDKMMPLIITKGSICQVKGGAVSHDDIMGTPYGGRTYSTNKKSWVTILHPTPELWTVTLPHRTQILYSTDISLITMQLELRPGSVVCESGTGSGSLSHSIARTIAPSGKLYTFEFHSARVEIAREEFHNHNLANVQVEQRDVCENGFGLSNLCDAVFLDLPKPWEALLSAKEALKLSGGRLCSFSPCLEQVQRTYEMLTSLEFAGKTKGSHFSQSINNLMNTLAILH